MHGAKEPVLQLDRGRQSTPEGAMGRQRLGSAVPRVLLTVSHAGWRRAAGGQMEVLYARCAGLAVHKDTMVACVRHTVNGTIK